MEALLFWIFAIVGVAGGMLTVWHRNPMGSAISLVLTMLCLAGLYVLLNGVFVATIQVLIYAGAVMVLILFVIMMLNLQEEFLLREGSLPVWIFAGIIGVIVVWKLGGLFSRSVRPLPESSEAFGTLQAVGMKLFGAYALPFELTSILLLIAIIGAVILARRTRL
ncbi:NADH-quinone oxidoreductase subunit J [Candidatus Entotheonellaceae bacterium PAL068K]